ncbi:Diaminopimelate epimerase-like protein [Hypoxylon rubiginosum]|uniref:Diaminopimelate epimerase-like protein n=1 Tax=Hypoxylon rubiginosum TaxID=110542 RepID=A0ACB9Z4F8_9PEZI|nr:Diaminopimelate epimerase-like protein [Hypoxylon rubiginosum]
MALAFTTFDVFTTTPFRGNPLAIVQVPAGAALPQVQKQLLAREFNLSETVFLHEQTADDVRARRARVDIFTPIAEVAFAGHPTVGAANFLLHHLNLASGTDVLITKAGPVPFKEVILDGAPAAELAVAHDVHVHDPRAFAGAPYAEHPVVSVVNGMTALMARLPDLAALRRRPTANLVGTENTYTAKERLDEGWRSGPVVSYFYVDLGYRVDGVTGDRVRVLRTRNFGSREDPATGSMASGLCAFLSLVEKDENDDGGEEGGEPTLTRRYEVTQGVEIGRRGEIHVRVTLDGSRKGIEEILLSGNAVKILEGKVPIPPSSESLLSE